MIRRPILIALSLVFLSSCDVEVTKPQNNQTPPAAGAINQPIRPITQLSASQIATARRICQNLRGQRLFLGSQPNGATREFSVEDTDCSTGVTTKANLLARLNLAGASYLWNPQRPVQSNINFHSEILTDRSIEMDRFCEEVQTDDVVENTLLVGSQYIRYDFVEFSQVDRISLYAHESVQGQWRVRSIDEYEIDKSLSPNLRGQTTASRHQYICLASNRVGQLIQRLR